MTVFTPAIAYARWHGYCSPVAANSANGLGNPNNSRRTSAPITIAGAFFVPAVQRYGGRAWEALAPAGFLEFRFTNPRTAATHSLGNERGSSTTQGAVPMLHTLSLNPSKVRAAAHRAMAVAALHSNSSLSVRLKRYNSAMAKARALETGGVQ